MNSTDESKKLALRNPPIIGYLHHAHKLSIASVIEGFDTWLLNYFIQLKCHTDLSTNRHRQLDFYHDSHNPDNLLQIDAFDGLLWIDFFAGKELVQHYKDGMVDFLIDQLNMNKYVEFTVDEFFIPGTSFYKKFTMGHQILVHGYDLNKKTFNIATFIQEQFTIDAEISFHELLEAFQNAPWFFCFLIRIPDEPIKPVMDITKICNTIENYLAGRRSANDESRQGQDTSVYGIRIYECVTAYVDCLINRKTHYDVRPLHLLWEHKKLMKMRIEAMEAADLLNPEQGVTVRYTEVESLVRISRALLMKYQITKGINLLDKIKVNLKKTLELETELLTEVLDMIKRSR
ncbi:hypothetical protein [Paenibacillus sp. LPE1-1-1.1]|uniref:hypothetical protein n=1 Tax=Paenibacillus sp. LPE1-1-1.1 TaxID=3135230 RepID=UPI0034439991